jgi:hypothetical protein
MQINFLKEQLDVAMYKIRLLKHEEDVAMDTASSKSESRRHGEAITILHGHEKQVTNELQLIESSLKEIKNLKLQAQKMNTMKNDS